MKNRKRILYIPQFSMNDKEYAFIDADGAFLMLKIVLKYFKNHLENDKEDPGYLIRVIVPPADVVKETVFYSDIAKLVEGCQDRLDVQYLWGDGELSPIINRYNFCPNDWRSHLTHADAVINNIPEITRNIRALLGPRYLPIISCHHFPDYIHENKLVTSWRNGNTFSYFWRQLDGYLSSDLNVFNCRSSLEGWKEALNHTGIPLTFAMTPSATHFPYLDLDELGLADEPRAKKFDQLTAVFPARITESKYTNWEKVFQLFTDDSTNGRVIICNPSRDKGWDVLVETGPSPVSRWVDNYSQESLELFGERLNFNVSPNKKIWVSRGLTRDQYVNICRRAHVGICLYEHERYGGISIREVVAYGRALPVSLNRFECQSWFRDVMPPYLISNLDELGPVKYNMITNLYGTSAHEKVLENFYVNEHYVRYTPNFAKVIEEIHGI